MTQPKVSIIIPVYGVEKYLEECLDSVINQTLKEIEIICVDDNSTDNTVSIIKKYASQYDFIKVIENKTKNTRSNEIIKEWKGDCGREGKYLFMVWS